MKSHAQLRSNIVLILLVLSLAAGMLFFSLFLFDSVALNSEQYDKYQAELDVYDSVGVSPEDLRRVQLDMAISLSSGRMINTEVVLFGVQQPIFNERELTHMQDVLGLFQIEQLIERVSIFVFLTLLLLCVTMQRWIGVRHDHRKAFAGLIALGVLVLPALALFVAGGFSFDGAFIKFHELFFTNDLWLLNPATDAMIRMYPQQFFEMMVRDIGIRVGAACLAVALLPLLTLIPWRRNDREQNPNSGD